MLRADAIAATERALVLIFLNFGAAQLWEGTACATHPQRLRYGYLYMCMYMCISSMYIYEYIDI